MTHLIIFEIKKRRLMFKKYAAVFASTAIATYACYKIYRIKSIKKEAKVFQKEPPLKWQPPKRNTILTSMKTQIFDLLVIGGGSAGAGCALDGVTRGLKVCMINDGDFASETSSKSTKLLHGGIRYLEKAFKRMSIKQFSLVRESLTERKNIMEIAPFLTNKLQIMLPVHNNFMVPYFWAGLKFYDYISGSKTLGSSKFINKSTVLDEFPAIKSDNLCGGVVYYDAQFNDSRLNILLALTSLHYGGVVANYVKAERFISKEGRVNAVVCKDLDSGEIFVIRAKGVINATGPYIDKIRLMESQTAEKLVAPSSGVHIVLPKEYAPKTMGLVIPGSTEGRVLFFLPWKGKALVGTTDNKSKAIRSPKPTKEEINFILDEIRENTGYPEMVKSKNILAAWSGIRPLIRDSTKSTESLVRSHIINISPGKVITLSGGKWTTYRKMAEETIDTAIRIFKLKPKRSCVTKYVKILGGHRFDESLHLRVNRDMGLSMDISKHLSLSYGDRTYRFRDYIQGNPVKLCGGYDYLEKEIDYCVDNEMAIKVMDVLARRLSLAFIDVKAASRCVERVSVIMKRKLQWKESKRKEEVKEAFEYLKTLGSELK